MVKNPPEGCQRIVPYLLYEDASAAIEFLGRVVGFEERMNMADEKGVVMHAEMGMGDDVVMLSTAVAAMGHAGRKSLPAAHSFVMCYVDDVDAHHAKAKAEGANILSEPEDQFYGDRSYRVLDLEDNLWCFQTHIKDVPLEEMIPPG